MVSEINKKEKALIIITLTLMIGCYNAYTLSTYFVPNSFNIGFPFYTKHTEPIQWYMKDLGDRVAIFLLGGLLYFLIEANLNRKYTILLRATVLFLAKDVLDYIVCYDQFPSFWDIVFYLLILGYVVFKK